MPPGFPTLPSWFVIPREIVATGWQTLGVPAQFVCPCSSKAQIWSKWRESAAASAAWNTTPPATIGGTAVPAPSALLVQTGAHVAVPQPASLNAASRPELFATNARFADAAGTDGTSAPPSVELVQLPMLPAVDASSATSVAVEPSHRDTSTVPPTALPARVGPKSLVPPRFALCVTAPPYSSSMMIRFAPTSPSARNKRPSDEAAGGPYKAV